MTAVLYAGLLLVGTGVGGAAVWFLQNRNLPGPGVHTGPMLAVPEHPRYGKLLDTPADGIEVKRPDGTLYVGLHQQTIPRKQVDGHPPWTGSQPALTEDQVIEMDRRAWARRELEALGSDPTDTGVGRVFAGLRALPAPAKVYGEAPVATLLAAERGLSFDCGNGLHAPVCDGRHCSCSCHRSAA